MDRLSKSERNLTNNKLLYNLKSDDPNYINLINYFNLLPTSGLNNQNLQITNDTRTKEIKKYLEYLQLINTNLENSKYHNFWTIPYSLFDGRSAAELGHNLVKLSTYIGVGEAIPHQVVKGVKRFIDKARGFTPNYLGNHVELMKSRLRNGMAEKLADNIRVATLKHGDLAKQITHYDLGDPGDLKYVLNKLPEVNPLSSKFNLTPKNMGVSSLTNIAPDGTKGYYTGIFEDSKDLVKGDLDATNNIILGHEYSHFVYRPTEAPPELATDIKYLTKRFGAEQAARGSQIKNYFGLADDSPVTPRMLRYAKKHYVKDTKVNNSMTKLLDSIQEFDKYAKWINKLVFAALTLAPVREVIKSAYNENNRRKDRRAD